MNIRLKGIRKSFGSVPVLRNIDLELGSGRFTTLLGPSGCGKTTLLRIVAGLERPDGGEVYFDDECVFSDSRGVCVPTEKRGLGFVFQDFALWPHLTVFENVAFGLRSAGRTEELAEKVLTALHAVRLDGFDRRWPHELSGGQQQRVALARALVVKPDILLLDEPLSALDRKIRGEMQYEIRNIQQAVGITTIFVTHDQEEALTMSDKIILMNRGHIEQEGDPWSIYRRPQSEFASDFLGKANLLDAELFTAPSGERRVRGAGWELPVSSGAKDGAVKVAVRGEEFRIRAAAETDAVPFRIERKIFVGATCRLTGHIGEDALEISALSPAVESYQPGDTVYVSVRPSSLICYGREE